MLKNRYIDIVCIVIILFAVVVTVLFMNGEALGIVSSNTVPSYATRLFDDSYVHTVDLKVDDWKGFIENAADEEYISCTAVIDGEAFSQVGLRAKGNNSRRLTEEYGLSRYSLKLEFDHFQSSSYYGLDKLSLDSSFQDNSYMKTYIAYDMMDYMGVPSPLCSYVWVTVNDQPWGLFLAVEEPEEAFAKRNFGKAYGELYKPDYLSLNDENADVALKYIDDDDAASYDNIFRNSKFDITEKDKARLIDALKTLSQGENLETAINVDEVLRYFAAQVFVLNPDSYLGPTGHNYFLYEEEGIISILPWDYNLAFGTYCLGMSDPIRDPNILINYPIDTPWDGETMKNRPLFHNVMKNNEYFALYHEYLDRLISEYIERGRCEAKILETMEMIAPYVEKDSTAFCSYEDFQTAVQTLIDVCTLRGESIRGQLDGKYPSTHREVSEGNGEGVDALDIDLYALGDFDDLENAKDRQNKVLEGI